MTEKSYLGRGYEPVAGRPFGWAWHRERDEIRAHLRRRIERFGEDCLAPARLEQRVSRIQERLHKNKPTFGERHAAWLARQPRATSASISFSIEELERIVEHFAGANDPTTASIAAKADAALERLRT